MAPHPPGAVLEGIFTEHIRFVRSHPGVPRLTFSELQRPEDIAAKRIVRAFPAGYANRILGAIQRGQTAGAFPPDLDPTAAAGLFLGGIQGLVTGLRGIRRRTVRQPLECGGSCGGVLC